MTIVSETKHIIKMAKKLLTADITMIQQVENVLKEKSIKYAKYLVEEEGTTKAIIAVLNKNGEKFLDIVKSIKTNQPYYFGVLRNHPLYSVPKHLLKELNEKEA